MLNRFFDWLQSGWGAKAYGDDTSFSHRLLESLNFWTILEGTHLLTLMLFFGSILLVDLRLLGLTFRELPISTLERRLLPGTIVALVVVLATGGLLFFAEPARYWHNLMFRAKLVVLVLAFANIAVLHGLIERNKADWDSAARPPVKARWSGAVSLASWVLVMATGRLIAYNWFECGKAQPDWVNASQDCPNSPKGALSADGKPVVAVRQ
jgi:hypothetical protein